MNDIILPTPSLADPDAVRERLQDWLNINAFAGKSLTISSFEIPEGTGMSNITVLFDARWNDNGKPQSQPMVARLQAQGDKLAFPTYDLPMQFAAMEMPGKIPGINVPTLVTQETTGTVLGMPFYIMQKTDGLIPPDIPPYHMDGWIVASTAEERARLWWSGDDGADSQAIAAGRTRAVVCRATSFSTRPQRTVALLAALHAMGTGRSAQPAL